MNRRKIEEHIPKVIDLLKEYKKNNKYLFVDGKIPQEYKGYISNFAASIVQSGLLTTVAFYENCDSSSNEDRSVITKIILKLLKDEDSSIKENTLLEYLLKKNIDLKLAEEKIINLLIALKLGMRVFEFSDVSVERKKKDKGNLINTKKNNKSSIDIESLSNYIQQDLSIKLNEEKLKKYMKEIDNYVKELQSDYNKNEVDPMENEECWNLICHFSNSLRNKESVKNICNKLKNSISELIVNSKEKGGNLGYLYYKDYYKDYFQKDKDCFFEYKNEKIKFESMSGRLKNIDKLEGNNIRHIKLKTTYPGLLIGSGYNHIMNKKGEYKLGLEFDYTTGLPIINGSSVKGNIRSYFFADIEKCEDEEEKSFKIKLNEMNFKYIFNIIKKIKKEEFEFDMNDFECLTREIFDGIKDGETINIYSRDIFYDAIICTEEIAKDKYILGEDYITPHKSPIKNPNPIKFLKVMPDVIWDFQFDLKDGDFLTADEKKELFKEILLEVGIGAKTNVGYGCLEACD